MNNVASTILQQLGGGEFLAMTGAKDFVQGDRELGFRVGRNPKKVSRVLVLYNPASDLYTFQTFTGRGVNMEQAANDGGIYAEDLRKLFIEHTGLETRL